MKTAEETLTELEQIQDTFQKRDFKARRLKDTEVPQLIVTLPDKFSTIQLAPLYDVHIGNAEHDAVLFARHLKWLAQTPNVFSFNGGDIFENKTPNEGKMGHDTLSPEEQIEEVTKQLAPIQHKLLFSLPGNHEDRTMKQSGMSSAKRLADNLQLPYFTDYCLCTIKWRGNNFRMLAHHGTGSATTAGAQRMAARKDLVWLHPDIMWTGHLHQPLADTVYYVDIDPATGASYERTAFVVISPSYCKYFGGYGAKARMMPGARGLTVITLNEDGRIDASIHARGKRL